MAKNPLIGNTQQLPVRQGSAEPVSAGPAGTENIMNIGTKSNSSITYDQAVRLNAVKIREAVKLGPEKTISASKTDLIMVAFATCDRQRWIPNVHASSTELWAQLDNRQREAIDLYLGGK